MAIQEEFFGYLQPTEYPANDAVVRSRKLMQRIKEIETGWNLNRKPQLRPEIRECLYRSNTELLWLRDTKNMTFPGIDYSLIDGVETIPLEELTRVRHICDVDEMLKDEIVEELKRSEQETGQSLLSAS